MISVCHIITGLNVGGAERALCSLLTGGLQAHVENHVVSLMGDGHYGPLLRQAGIPVHAVGMSPGRPSPLATMRLRKIVRLIAPDIVQGWMYHGNLAAVWARRSLPNSARMAWNIRRSLEAREDLKLPTRLAIWLNAAFSGRASAIIYNSERGRSQHEAAGFSTESSICIPNGFNTDTWSPSESARKEVRHELAFQESDVIAGFVGRGVAEKNLPMLFSAFGDVADRLPSVKLVCVGRDIAPHVPDRMKHKIVLLGERRDVPRLLNGIDVLCLSSKVEGFPNVIAEAMASAVPCVTTDVGDACAIVGDTGWVVPVGDAGLYASALEEALSCSVDRRRMLGLAARHRIEGTYSLPTVVGRYAELYRNLGT